MLQSHLHVTLCNTCPVPQKRSVLESRVSHTEHWNGSRSCTIICFVYAFPITEDTSLKLLGGRFIGALCLPTQVMNQKSTWFRKEKNSFPMLKSTSTTCLELIFLCIKPSLSKSPLDLRNTEIDLTPCWNTSSLGQLLQTRRVTEKQA